jgi:hypothetical protein
MREVFVNIPKLDREQPALYCQRAEKEICKLVCPVPMTVLVEMFRSATIGSAALLNISCIL